MIRRQLARSIARIHRQTPIYDLVNDPSMIEAVRLLRTRRGQRRLLSGRRQVRSSRQRRRRLQPGGLVGMTASAGATSDRHPAPALSAAFHHPSRRARGRRAERGGDAHGGADRRGLPLLGACPAAGPRRHHCGEYAGRLALHDDRPGTGPRPAVRHRCARSVMEQRAAGPADDRRPGGRQAGGDGSHRPAGDRARRATHRPGADRTIDACQPRASAPATLAADRAQRQSAKRPRTAACDRGAPQPGGCSAGDSGHSRQAGLPASATRGMRISTCRMRLDPAQPVWLLLGPEGGFAGPELDHIAGAGLPPAARWEPPCCGRRPQW